MKRSQRARRISEREQARRRRQQREAQLAEEERAQLEARPTRVVDPHDVAASISGIHRIPPGLLSGGAAAMPTRTQARGR